MDLGIDGKIALVTGASRGIGREISLCLARNGADVALNYGSNDGAASEVEREIKRLGRRAVRLKCSVSDYEAAASMVKAAAGALGPIDILVNNAGVIRDKYLINMDPKDWLEVINTNLIGMFNVTRDAAFSMMRRKRGRIINMASLSAIAGSAGQTNYTASKGGVIGFTKSLSKELAPFNITVNAVAPGYIETDMLRGMPGEMLDGYLKLIPSKRFGSPSEVADLVAFLASDRAGYINGQVIRVDGGLL